MPATKFETLVQGLNDRLRDVSVVIRTVLLLLLLLLLLLTVYEQKLRSETDRWMDGRTDKQTDIRSTDMCVCGCAL